MQLFVSDRSRMPASHTWLGVVWRERTELGKNSDFKSCKAIFNSRRLEAEAAVCWSARKQRQHREWAGEYEADPKPCLQVGGSRGHLGPSGWREWSSSSLGDCSHVGAQLGVGAPPSHPSLLRAPHFWLTFLRPAHPSTPLVP